MSRFGAYLNSAIALKILKYSQHWEVLVIICGSLKHNLTSGLLIFGAKSLCISLNEVNHKINFF